LVTVCGLSLRGFDHLAEPVLSVLERPSAASHDHISWLEFLARNTVLLLRLVKPSAETNNSLTMPDLETFAA
jgi:hypothetical protein